MVADTFMVKFFIVILKQQDKMVRKVLMAKKRRNLFGKGVFV